MNQQSKWMHAIALTFCLAASSAMALEVTIDVSEAPEHKAWAERAAAEMEAWHGRLDRLIPTEGFTPTDRIHLIVRKQLRVPAFARGNTIEVSGAFIAQDDGLGVIIHEQVHVIQAYRGRRTPGWLQEGIADYLRWAVYDAKPMSFFQKPREEKGYLKGYRVAAGFLAWLEADLAPGIVKRVNTALRKGTYSDDLFIEQIGRPLPDLWQRYLAAYGRPLGESKPDTSGELPEQLSIFSYSGNGGGIFEKDGEQWIEKQNGEIIWRFKQTAKTESHLDLLDEGRNVEIRLTASAVLFRPKGGEWRKLYDGKWSTN